MGECTAWWRWEVSRSLHLCVVLGLVRLALAFAKSSLFRPALPVRFHAPSSSSLIALLCFLLSVLFSLPPSLMLCRLEELQGLLLRFDFNDFYAGGGAASAAARDGAASGDGSDRE